MTKEQEKTLYRLNKDIKNPLTCGDMTIVNIEDIETVLNMLKEKDAEIEKKDKIIYEMMGSFLDIGFGFEYCNNDNRCINDCEECLMKYFKRKAINNG